MWKTEFVYICAVRNSTWKKWFIFIQHCFPTLTHTLSVFHISRSFIHQIIFQLVLHANVLIASAKSEAKPIGCLKNIFFINITSNQANREKNLFCAFLVEFTHVNEVSNKYICKNYENILRCVVFSRWVQPDDDFGYNKHQQTWQFEWKMRSKHSSIDPNSGELLTSSIETPLVFAFCMEFYLLKGTLLQTVYLKHTSVHLKHLPHFPWLFQRSK